MVLAYHELFYKSNSRSECWLHSYIRIALILYQCMDETKQIQTKPYNIDLLVKYWSIPLTLVWTDSLDGVVLILKELVYDGLMVSDETVNRNYGQWVFSQIWLLCQIWHFESSPKAIHMQHMCGYLGMNYCPQNSREHSQWGVLRTVIHAQITTQWSFCNVLYMGSSNMV